MPIAILKSASFILILLTILLSGCADTEKEKAQKLEDASALTRSGDFAGAGKILEKLAKNHPDELPVLIAVADLHQAQGNKKQAALALQKAQQLAPDNIELLYRTLIAQQAAGQPTGPYLESLAGRAPEAMNPELWEQLGAVRSSEGKTQAALDAYLKAADFQGHTTSPASASAIGKLFLQLDNLPQAERWFSGVADSNDPNALSALFGLLEIHHRNEDWPKAELILDQLQEQFPGSVKASRWANLPDEIAGWRKAQQALQAELEAKKQPSPGTTDDDSSESAPSETASSPEIAADEPITEEAPSGKDAALADLDAAMAMADAPALEAEDLVPAEDFEEEITPPSAPDPAQLVRDARIAEQERDYKTAIQLYWQALGPANESAEIWNRLSLAYLVDGQIQNAETAALESLRLLPESEQYMLDYLRIAQRTKPLADFLTELERAYERFPKSPDIVLSLARTHERIDGSNEAAANAYRLFIELAPAHPLRSEAEAALNRLL